MWSLKGLVLVSVCDTGLPRAHVQEDTEVVLHLLLPLLLHDADAIPRGGAGDDKAAHHEDHHCSARTGRLRLLRLWHEPDRSAADPQGAERHHRPQGDPHPSCRSSAPTYWLPVLYVSACQAYSMEQTVSR